MPLSTVYVLEKSKYILDLESQDATLTSHINYFSCPQSFFSQMLLVEIREIPTLKLCYYMVYSH